MEDLDLDTVGERVRRLEDWRAELHDTRLSDAPYVSITVDLPSIGEPEVARLKEAFSDLPHMRVSLWQRGAEVPLQAADVSALEIAARSLPARRE
jgi:hypothetical protein